MESKKLIVDTRTAGPPYNRYFSYDAGGNRQTMTDSGDDLAVDYEYDYEDVEKYGTANNRLMIETLTNTSTLEVISKYYYYNDVGNVEWIVTGPPDGGSQSLMAGGEGGSESSESGSAPSPLQVEDPPGSEEGWGEGDGGGMAMLRPPAGCGDQSTRYKSIRFGYAANGRAVTFVHDEEWCSDAPISTYKINWAREFRDDSPRARYLERWFKLAR